MPNETLLKIKTIVSSVLPENEIILFGSRARQDFQNDSDYDILIIIPDNITIKQKMTISTRINKLLVNNSIIADIIIQSKNEVKYKQNLRGSVVREAVKEGLLI